jgi:hypothetical protein
MKLRFLLWITLGELAGRFFSAVSISTSWRRRSIDDHIRWLEKRLSGLDDETRRLGP